MPQTGPRTTAGKQITRLNAVRHGIFANTPVVPGVERIEDWQRFHDSLIAGLDPDGAVEAILAEHVVVHAWRLERLFRHEAEVTAVSFERAPADYARVAAYRSEPVTVAAAEEQLRLAAEALSTFRTIGGMKKSEPLPGAVCEIIVVTSQEGPAAAAGAPDFEGLPPVDDWDGFEGWTVGLLVSALDQVAARRGMTKAAHHQRTTHLLELHLEGARGALDDVHAGIDRLRRQRTVPGDREIHTIIRYQAQIERAMYRALHELQVLQAKRRGEPVAITRLQVHGLPGA